MGRAVILGASRGLGAELVKQVCAAEYGAVGFGRKESLLAALRERFPSFEYHVADFSRRAGQDDVLKFVLSEDYAKVFCVAGGGPYGRFADRDWKDHQWAWEVSYLFPARVLHTLAVARRTPQVILIGSAVAESAADPMAASYCAAKHALVGLVMSLRAEYPGWDLRLFSPGYMDTDLLPKNAAVRQLGTYSPVHMAHELWQWSLGADSIGHKVYPKSP
jgi:3-hydroxybutyrate dehydrogenase